jgi:uncharacterized protein YkwD
MSETQQRRRRAGVAGVTVACALALGGAPASANAAPSGLATASAACAGAETPIALTSVAGSRGAFACLIDGVRQERGLGTLRFDARLGAAAREHADDMVDRRYFAHVTPGGANATARLKQEGWPGAKANGWWAGEILALGDGEASTPRRIVAAWLTSPPHRAILLSAKPTRVGIGVARDTPDGEHPADGVTVAAELGLVCPAAGSADPLSGYDSDPVSSYQDFCAGVRG